METRILFPLILLSTGLVFAQPCGASGRFENTGSPAFARSRHTATLLSNGKVLVVGGFFSDGYVSGSIDTVEVYDPTSGTWTSTGS